MAISFYPEEVVCLKKGSLPQVRIRKWAVLRPLEHGVILLRSDAQEQWAVPGRYLIKCDR